MARIWKLPKSIHGRKYFFNKPCSSFRLIQSDVIRDFFQLIQSGIRPYYFSHFCIRSLAFSWEVVLPSKTALSPLDNPSSSASLRCMNS